MLKPLDAALGKGMGEHNKTVDILVMRAAAEIRKAAALDKKRATELGGVADYLESIVYETELGYGEPLFPETVADETIPSQNFATQSFATDEIKRMMKPFKVRLTR